MGIENPANKHPHTDDAKLAEKFPARQVTIDSNGVVHTVESDAQAAEMHQKELEDA